MILKEVALMQVCIYTHYKYKVPKQRDLINTTPCTDSAGYKIEIMQCFIIVTVCGSVYFTDRTVGPEVFV